MFDGILTTHPMLINRREFFNPKALQEGKPGVKEYPLPLKELAYQNRRLPNDLDMPTQGVAPYTGSWGPTQAMHLLRRTCFGYTVNEVKQLSQMGMEQAVDQLLDTDLPLPSPPLNYYNTADITDPQIPLGQTWVNDTQTLPQLLFPRSQSYKAWAIGLMLHQDTNIREKMTLFWHHHFATELEVIKDARGAYVLNSYHRKNCLGNFKQMVKDVSKDPSMLFYLNGYKNSKDAPDENYARELFELFTLGRGPDSGYTESDVIEAAKVLTGWRINPAPMESFFVPSQHHTGDKSFSSFFNHHTIKGKTGPDGAQEKDELVDMIFAKKEVVARFICRKIYRFFHYYHINATIENAVIQEMARVLIDHNWEIKPVMSLFLKSNHFYEENSMACLIKNPLDFFIGFGRLFHVEIPSDPSATYRAWSLIHFFVGTQGMDYNDPPSVSGWPAYHQEPQYHQIWINSDTLSKRKQIVEMLFLPRGLTVQNTYIRIDLIAFVSEFSDPSDPNILVKEACEACVAFPISAPKQQEMKAILLGFQTGDFYWSGAWNAYRLDPSNEQQRQIVFIRLFSMFQYLLSLPEYQLS
jgi:uncharacterized protein (DUF1800 family)